MNNDNKARKTYLKAFNKTLKNKPADRQLLIIIKEILIIISIKIVLVFSLPFVIFGGISLSLDYFTDRSNSLFDYLTYFSILLLFLLFAYFGIKRMGVKELLKHIISYNIYYSGKTGSLFIKHFSYGLFFVFIFILITVLMLFLLRLFMK